jgi:hypothetical protein
MPELPHWSRTDYICSAAKRNATAFAATTFNMAYSGGIHLDATRDRVGDVLFGDYSNHIFWSRDAITADHKRHSSMLSPHTLDYVEYNIIFAYDGEIAARNVPQPQAGLCCVR